MAYMQKYPSSTKATDLLDSVSEIVIEGGLVDPDPIARGEDQFAWPPPSATANGPGRLLASRQGVVSGDGRSNAA